MDSDVKKRLENCTKDELIWMHEQRDFLLSWNTERALAQVEQKRVEKKLKEAENWATIENECRNQYIAILRGEKSLNNRTIEVLNELLRDVERADEEYNKCMKEVDSYGLQ